MKGKQGELGTVLSLVDLEELLQSRYDAGFRMAMECAGIVVQRAGYIYKPSVLVENEMTKSLPHSAKCLTPIKK